MLKQPQLRLSQLASAVAVIVGGISVLPAAHAAAPAAGVNISNIASASYTDQNGVIQTASSNEVKTTVLQVASFSLVANRTTTANPNGQVSLSHTLTNTGNATDNFTIDLTNVAGDNFQYTTFKVFVDANGDGSPDNSTDVNGQTVQLAPGQSVNLIVVATVPATATDGQNGKLTISATSVFDTATTDSNTDTVNVNSLAKIVVTKSASIQTVQAGDFVTYTLKYRNDGNTTATDVTLSDLLDSNLEYVNGSARWSATGATVLTEADDAADAFKVVGSTATFVVPSVAPNTEGQLTFQVQVKAATPAGAIPNVANFTYDPDGPGGTPTGPSEQSNISTITVGASYLGAINDSSTDNYNDGERTVTNDDTISQPVNQGQSAVFETYVWNRGNTAESYNLTADTTNLPPGTTVTFLKTANGTQYTDSNGDSIVDTGPVAVGAKTPVYVRITLPQGYTGVIGPDNLATIVTATPVHNTAAPDVVNLVISDIITAGVDLTNGGNTPADGDGPYDSNTIVDAATTEAGQPVTFPIAVTNDGPANDTFQLSATVPPGWTVTFYDADDITGACSTTVVTNTGSLASGATNKLCAVVTPPANATPGTSDVIFNVTSTSSGATDSMKDQVTVDENRSFVFTPDRTGTIAPGGTVVYSHTLQNTGNVTEGDQAGELPIAVTNSLAGTTTTLYVDLNNNGTAEANEQVLNNDLNSVLPGGLAPNQTVTVLVKVQSPSGATNGQQDAAIVTITPTGTVNGEAAPSAVTVTDTTNIVSGGPLVRLYKYQAIDADCNGMADGAYSMNTLSAKPGECVVYRIDAINEGTANATNLVIEDAIPAYTTLNGTVNNAGTSGTVGNTATTVTNTVGTLAPAATASLGFGVQIDQ